MGKSWGKNIQKSSKMFGKLFPKFSLINQAKPLKTQRFKKPSTTPHNPKVVSSSLTPATTFIRNFKVPDFFVIIDLTAV